MKKNQSIVILIVLLVITGGILTLSNRTAPEAPATPTSTSQPSIVSSTSVPEDLPTPYSGDFVRLAWFYKPPDGTQMDLVTQNMDFFILTHKDENARDEFRADGVTAPFSQYLLFLVINDPGDCEDQPTGNQVAYKPGDFCQISEQHPDWFLLDQNGERLMSRKDSYYMDPGNEEFRAFWLQRARELQETYGWDNIFLDNVEASRTKMVNNNRSIAGYPDDESYQKAVAGFLAYIRENYFQPKGKPIYANVVSVADDKVWEEYLQHLDGVMIESFATDWSDGYRSRDEWEQQMNLAEKALAQSRTLILVAQGEREDNKLQNFAFASYLLIADGNAFFRYSHQESYRELWLYENYDFDLGSPLGARYKDKGGWRRDFANGYVTVNPQSRQAEIVLNP